MQRMRSLIVLSFCLSLLLLAGAAAPASAQQPPDYPIPGGRFYTQAGAGQGGFSVVDDGNARFYSEFNRLGLQNVGYPISRRFMYEGFVTQAFQKLVLQWRPEVNQAWPVNVFDELHENGFDERLLAARQTPYPIANFDPPGASWSQIIANRQALLNANASIRARYFSVSDPLNVFGLPVSRVEDMGNHYAIRTQRAVFQQWKSAVPWAAAGQVTVANGGDIAKEMGWLSGVAIQPESTPGDPGPIPTEEWSAWTTRNMIIGPGNPGRLYALQLRSRNDHQQGRALIEQRILTSDDRGSSWGFFGGGLPFNDDCTHNITMDYATQDALYAITCQGFYRWTGSAWAQVASQGVAVTPGNPRQLWALTTSNILRSDDGGATWVEAASNLNGGTMGLGIPGSVIVTGDPTPTVYGMLGIGRSGTTILRATPGGQWSVFPEPWELMMHAYGVVRDDTTGALYLYSPMHREIWRIPNPSADPAQLTWERVASTAGIGTTIVHLLAARSDANGLALYVSEINIPDNASGAAQRVYRSLDGGQSWQAITFP